MIFFHFLITLELSTKPCLGTPEQNGVAKRKHRHIEIARAIMFTINVPNIFQSKVIQTVAYLINRMSFRVLSYRSHFKVLSHNTPLFSLSPKTFRCIYYVQMSKSDCTKLDPKALKCVFLGYGVDKKGYKCYHPPTRHKFVPRDVTFF